MHIIDRSRKAGFRFLSPVDFTADRRGQLLMNRFSGRGRGVGGCRDGIDGSLDGGHGDVQIGELAKSRVHAGGITTDFVIGETDSDRVIVDCAGRQVGDKIGDAKINFSIGYTKQRPGFRGCIPALLFSDDRRQRQRDVPEVVGRNIVDRANLALVVGNAGQACFLGALLFDTVLNPGAGKNRRIEKNLMGTVELLRQLIRRRPGQDQNIAEIKRNICAKDMLSELSHHRSCQFVGFRRIIDELRISIALSRIPVIAVARA